MASSLHFMFHCICRLPTYTPCKVHKWHHHSLSCFIAFVGCQPTLPAKCINCIITTFHVSLDLYVANLHSLQSALIASSLHFKFHCICRLPTYTTCKVHKLHWVCRLPTCTPCKVHTLHHHSISSFSGFCRLPTFIPCEMQKLHLHPISSFMGFEGCQPTPPVPCVNCNIFPFPVFYRFL